MTRKRIGELVDLIEKVNSNISGEGLKVRASLEIADACELHVYDGRLEPGLSMFYRASKYTRPYSKKGEGFHIVVLKDMELKKAERYLSRIIKDCGGEVDG